jgi:hypothetical protein
VLYFGTPLVEQFLTVDTQGLVAVQHLLFKVVNICGNMIVALAVDGFEVEALCLERMIETYSIQGAEDV